MTTFPDEADKRLVWGWTRLARGKTRHRYRMRGTVVRREANNVNLSSDTAVVVIPRLL